MPFTRPITPLSMAQLRMSAVVGTGRPVTTHGEGIRPFSISKLFITYKYFLFIAPLSPIKDQLKRPKTN